MKRELADKGSFYADGRTAKGDVLWNSYHCLSQSHLLASKNSSQEDSSIEMLRKLVVGNGAQIKRTEKAFRRHSREIIKDES